MGQGEESVSIGEEDQLREIEMEHEQRQHDDGVPPPKADRPDERTEPRRQRQADDKGPWMGRADDPEHPGQTDKGGLGGSGPVQP